MALLLLVVFSLTLDPSSFKITLEGSSGEDPVLTRYLMMILDYGPRVMTLFTDMTLVTATSGERDASVGVATAVAGSVIFRVLVGRGGDETLQASMLLAFLTAYVVAMPFGTFNGVLVSISSIQPIVATLILCMAGCSIAVWINNNELPIVADRSFTYFGGFVPGIPIPTPSFLAAVYIVITVLILKFTSSRSCIQAVGISSDSSRLNELNPTFIKWLGFMILGLCVVVVTPIKTNHLSVISYLMIARDIEMDMILIVVLDGNVLSDSKFNITASILRTYATQFLTTTLCRFNVSSDVFPTYKIMVVILLVVIGTPAIKAKLPTLGKSLRKQEEVS